MRLLSLLWIWLTRGTNISSNWLMLKIIKFKLRRINYTFIYFSEIFFSIGANIFFFFELWIIKVEEHYNSWNSVLYFCVTTFHRIMIWDSLIEIELHLILTVCFLLTFRSKVININIWISFPESHKSLNRELYFEV